MEQMQEHTVRSYGEDLRRLRETIARMGGLAERQVADAALALVRRDTDLAAEVVQRDAAIDALERAGAIERLDLPSGDHAYVACAPAHHHHVVCSGCGRTAEVADGDLAALVGEIGRRTGFRIDEHRLELFGSCPACVEAAGGGDA